MVFIDVDGVLNPHDDLGAAHLTQLGYHTHRYTGPGPHGATVDGHIWLNPQHGTWLAELAALGAELAWATSWGPQAANWIAPRLGLPDDMPNVDIGPYGATVRFGWSTKLDPIRQWAANRPFAWFDDVLGPRDLEWAKQRTADEHPTLLVEVAPHVGLTRAHIDTVRRWLERLG
ncbi:MAG: HAD domain-containing protein [Micromonosporaceae bacterium]